MAKHNRNLDNDFIAAEVLDEYLESIGNNRILMAKLATEVASRAYETNPGRKAVKHAIRSLRVGLAVARDALAQDGNWGN